MLSNWLIEVTFPDGDHWIMVKNCADPREVVEQAKLCVGSNPEAQVKANSVKRIPPGQEADAVKWAAADHERRYGNRIPTHEYTGGAPNRILSQPFVVPGSREIPSPTTDANLAIAGGYVK